jgi:Mrp family chromosome partitioning ATPase
VRPDDDGSDAVVSTAPSVAARLDDPVARGLLGGVLGLMVGIGIAMGLAQVDRRLWTRDAVEDAFDLPFLADIATFRGDHDDEEDAVVVHTEPMSGAAEGYRAVRSILQFLCSDTLPTAPNTKPATRVLVVSSTPGEGKSTTTANVAAAFGEAGLRVLALNADFRRPRLHKLFGEHEASPNLIQTPVEGITLLGNVPSWGGSKPSEVVARQRRALTVARDHFDVIVVDTAPLLSTNDALDLVNDVEVVIVVARYGHTTGGHARRVAELLRRVGAPAVGVVAVGAPNDLRDTAYYYPYDGAISRAPADARVSVKQLIGKGADSSVGNANGRNGANGASNGHSNGRAGDVSGTSKTPEEMQNSAMTRAGGR